MGVVTAGLLVFGLTGSTWANGPRVKEVNQRTRNQQKRIGEGLESGKISAGEAAKLEKQEAAIKRQERADRAAHNGHLTKAEQRDLNHELNQTSKEIYQDKHN